MSERYYPGLSPFWIDAGVTERQAEQYMEELREESGCSFCGRAPAEHGGSQIERDGARICSSCIDEFHAELAR